MFSTAEQHAPIGGDRLAALRRLTEIRSESAALAANLTPEDQSIQSMPDTSPTKWHLGHTTWFFETFILSRFDLGYRVFDPAFAYLFNSYYEAAGPRHPRPERGLLSRPTVDLVGTYRDYVTAAVTRLVERADEAAWREIAPLLELGLHHEQQHQELILMDIKHVFSINPLLPAYQAPQPRRQVAPAPVDWVEFAGGLVEIGHDGGGFAFDNEGPRHKVWLEPFRLASRPVSCGEYLAFIEDDGYRRPEFWLSDGWATVRGEDWEAPLYWRREPEGVVDLHLVRATPPQSRRARVPCQLLRGRRVRPMGRQAAAERGGMGDRRRGSGGARQFRRQRPASPRCRGPKRRRRLAPDVRRCVGMDREPLSRPTRGSAPRPAPWANTTASSCATRWCCAAARR